MKRHRTKTLRAARLRAAAIVPAAGSGTRLGLKTKKPFVLLGGKPLVVHTLEALSRAPAVQAIIVAADPDSIGRMQRLVGRYGLTKVRQVVSGGATRTESVRNALAALDDGFDIVLIHDAARPFIDPATIDRAVKTAARHGACIVAVPEHDTVKLVGRGGVIARTLDRSTIYRAQTPQAFRRAVIMDAYASGRSRRGVTDDAGLVERRGGRVRIVPGSYRNMKITTREDLQCAEVFLCG